MNLFGTIRLTDLLLQRDEAWVRVAECERQIQGILGEPYPFPPPPDLPSLRRKKPAKKERPTGIAIPRDAVKLRPLKRPAENAYRVVYQRGDVMVTSFLADADLLRRLLRLDQPEFRVLEIATVAAQTPETYSVLEIVWQAPEASPGVQH